MGDPLASGGKEPAVSNRVGFVSYRKQNRSACCAVSRRKLLVNLSWGFPRCHRKRLSKSPRRQLNLGFVSHQQILYISLPSKKIRILTPAHVYNPHQMCSRLSISKTTTESENKASALFCENTSVASCYSIALLWTSALCFRTIERQYKVAAWQSSCCCGCCCCCCCCLHSSRSVKGRGLFLVL